MLHFQRALLIGLMLWCASGLVEEISARRAAAAISRPHVLAPRKWQLGKPYVEKVRGFTLEAAAVIPDGEVVHVIANHRLAVRQRPMLRMWLAYLMPNHHIRLLPHFPKHASQSIEKAEVGSYVLAYRTRPVRIPKLEAVWEHSIGGVYRVTP